MMTRCTRTKLQPANKVQCKRASRAVGNSDCFVAYLPDLTMGSQTVIASQLACSLLDSSYMVHRRQHNITDDTDRLLTDDLRCWCSLKWK